MHRCLLPCLPVCYVLQLVRIDVCFHVCLPVCCVYSLFTLMSALCVPAYLSCLTACSWRCLLPCVRASPVSLLVHVAVDFHVCVPVLSHCLSMLLSTSMCACQSCLIACPCCCLLPCVRASPVSLLVHVAVCFHVCVPVLSHCFPFSRLLPCVCASPVSLLSV